VLGGLVAFNDGTIAQLYATGSVNGGPALAGGLVGVNYGTASQSYATGNVFGGSGAGGLVGDNRSVIGSINQSFATGVVQGSTLSPVGGIASVNKSTTIAADVYWDRKATKQTQSTGIGTRLPASNGLTTVQMSTPSSFASWDFSPTGAWAMPAGATHPILRWQLER
jgi:hypothetical protein